MRRDRGFLCQRGVSMVETLIALPMFVLLIFIIAELGLMYQAKAVLDVAALAAARSGAIHGGDAGEMRKAASLALTPLYTREASAAGVMEGMLRSRLDTSLPHMVGATNVIGNPSGPVFNGAGGGLQTGLTVGILSPTRQMVADFGVMRAYVAGSESSRREKVIPNDNLAYRDTRLIRSVNVQDANLLKIQVTYLYELKLPLTRYFFTPFMNANLTGVLFGGESAGSSADMGWRVPLVAYATVRMQSDFKEASLDGGSSGSSVNAGPSSVDVGDGAEMAATSSASNSGGGGLNMDCGWNDEENGVPGNNAAACNAPDEAPGCGCDGGGVTRPAENGGGSSEAVEIRG